jgi:prephenate dehydrogenase
VPDTPPFGTVAIVGVGLIGGSIALAARERWSGVLVVALDRPAVLAHALGSGAIDRGVGTLAELGDPDLIVLSAPVRQNVELLEQLAASGTRAIVTDVGGTKRHMLEASRALGGAMTFIGGHPIGGAERGGFAFARPDLFTGRPWIFTPPAETGPAADSEVGRALDRLFQFAGGLGARPSTMDAGQHDTLMAFLSHLPQLTASALMETAGAAAASEGLRLAGRGLVDTTRLASSPPGVWRDICATNADAIGQALDQLIARLTELRSDLARGDAIEAVFAEASRWRAELMKGRE